MQQGNYYVYFVASNSGVLYIGVTNNLERRISEHRLGLHNGFTKKYSCTKLVYYEHYVDARTAIDRETQLKKWSRSKKVNLIESINSEWRDLSLEWE